MATVAGTATEGRSIGGERLKEALVGYSFIAAPMILYGVLFFYPIGYAIYISRYDWGAPGPISKVGWGNYHDLLHEHRFGIEIKNGLRFTLGFTIASLGCPVGPMIQEDIDRVVREIPGVEDVEVELTFDRRGRPSGCRTTRSSSSASARPICRYSSCGA